MSRDPLLCRPDEKAEREAANGVAQLDYLVDLVVGERAITDIRETHLLDLQKLAIRDIYPCGARIAMLLPRSASAIASISRLMPRSFQV